jgi:hypothetical protein
MALIVEDGTVVAGADSYLSLADANTYHSSHGSPTAWASATNEAKEAALRYATMWIDGKFTWQGSITSESQVLDFPRSNVWDEQGRALGTNTIPQRLKDATAEMALAHVGAALNASLARGGQVRREQVGPIAIEYLEGANPETDYPYVKRLLSGYTSSQGARSVPVTRIA